MDYQALIVYTASQGASLSDILSVSPVQHFPQGQNNPDLLQIYPAKSSIGIEQILGLVEWSWKMPFQYTEKVAIVHSADKMTPHAQNALLKTMEEPPKQTLIILSTTNPSGLLPTIRSRARHIYLSNKKAVDFERVSLSATFLSKNYLERTKVIDELLKSNTDRETLLGLIRDMIQQSMDSPEPQSKGYLQKLRVLKTAYTAIKSGVNTKLTLEVLAMI